MTIELIITFLSGSAFTTVINAIIFRKKNRAETSQLTDEVWQKRIQFLDDIMTKRESLTCLKTTCEIRVK